MDQSFFSDVVTALYRIQLRLYDQKNIMLI